MEISLSDMMKMQEELYHKHKDTWVAREPEHGREHILYMIEEIGEMVAILKKKGDRTIMDDMQVRDAYVTEVADVMMYFIDVMLCYRITPEEFSQAFTRKYAKNISRDYEKEYEELYNG